MEWQTKDSRWKTQINECWFGFNQIVFLEFISFWHCWASKIIIYSDWLQMVTGWENSGRKYSSPPQPSRKKGWNEILSTVPWKAFVQREHLHCNIFGNGDLWSCISLVIVTSGSYNVVRQRRGRRWYTTWHFFAWIMRTLYYLYIPRDQRMCFHFI